MTHYLRYPHLARDLVTFVAEDDMWVASLSEAADGGARARPLTADRIPVQHPRLSPAGTHMAWTSARSLNRAASREAYAASADGGPVRRLTYWGDRFATVRGWVSDSEVLVLSRAGQHFSKKTWAFAVPLSGPARRLDYGPAGDVAVRDGAVLVGSAMNEPADPAQWKRYRGGAGGKIWYSPDGSHYTRILADAGDNLVNPMFVGSAGGVPLRPRGDRRALLRPPGRHRPAPPHRSQPVLRAARDDRRAAGGLPAGRGDLAAGFARRRAGAAGHPAQRRPHRPGRLSGAGDVAAGLVRAGLRRPSADGRGARHRALAARPTRRPGRCSPSPGVRARIPIAIPGRDAVACASDNGGEDGLDVLPTDGSAPRRIGHGEFGRILELAVAPDGRTAAVACADGRLLTVALAGEPVITEIARSNNAEFTGLAFSPDSALLAWSQPWRPESGAAQIRLVRLADGTVADVTPRRFDESSPVFTLDGRYLAFLSNRAFDPVFDTHLFRPRVPARHPALPGAAAGDDTVAVRAGAGRRLADPGAASATGHPDAGPPAAGLDVAGIAARIVAFPVAAGRTTSSAPSRDGLAWLEQPRPASWARP